MSINEQCRRFTGGPPCEVCILFHYCKPLTIGTKKLGNIKKWSYLRYLIFTVSLFNLMQFKAFSILIGATPTL